MTGFLDMTLRTKGHDVCEHDERLLVFSILSSFSLMQSIDERYHEAICGEGLTSKHSQDKLFCPRRRAAKGPSFGFAVRLTA